MRFLNHSSLVWHYFPSPLPPCSLFLDYHHTAKRRHGEIKESHVSGDPCLCMLCLTCTSSPGYRQDDELLYSQKESTSPTGPHTGRLSGEGTHLAGARRRDSNPVEQKSLESQKQNV